MPALFAPVTGAGTIKVHELELTMKGINREQDRDVSLGLYLKIARTARDLSLNQVSEATEKLISSSYLSMLENGKITRPSIIFLRALSTLYGIPLESLTSLIGGQALESEAAMPAPRLKELDVSPEEEIELVNYLGFLRKQQSKHDGRSANRHASR